MMGRKVLQLVAVYAPQGWKPLVEKEAFWGKLDENIGIIPEEN